MITKYEDVFATDENSATSPSGKYKLEKVIDIIDEVNSFSFRILDAEHDNIIYQSEDYYRTRDTHFILWGDDDMVWVYSGDVGVFYWEKEEESFWVKKGYAQRKEENIDLPEVLIALYPELDE